MPTARETEELVRAAKLTARQLAYFRLRAKGVTPVNAVRRAGYRPGSKRAATAMAHRLDGRLRDLHLLDPALIDEGITMISLAKAIRRGLDSDNPRVALSTAKYLGMLLGYGREQAEEPAPAESYDTFETLEQLRRMVSEASVAGPAKVETPRGSW